MSFKVMISYTWSNCAEQTALVNRLKTIEGVSPLYDRKDIKISASIHDSISNLLSQSDCVIVLLTREALSSTEVLDEITRAHERKKSILPIVAEDVNLNEIPWFLRDIKFVRYSHRNFDDVLDDVAAYIEDVSRAGTQHRTPVNLKENDLLGSIEYTDQEETKKILKVDPGAPDPKYSNLFHISSLTLPYVVIIGAWHNCVNEYRMGEVTSRTDNSIYKLPDDFLININRYSTIRRGIEPKCRLVGYDCDITARGEPNRLTFTFSEIEYMDYLMSGEHLDDFLPNNPKQTFRDKYAPRLDLHDLRTSSLTNICGVGIFIITRDDKIIISKHSKRVKVSADVWSYSASGTMSWKHNVNPFEEVARECFEEIYHEINIDDTYMFGFGVDAKKLYFQFSFFQESGLSSKEILNRAPSAPDFDAEMVKLEAIPYELDTILDAVLNRSWEPAAAAGLITLCAKKFGIDKVERAIDPEFVRSRFENEMMTEWERRAERPDVLAVMSARYPYYRCAEESEKYIQAVIGFIGKDVDDKDVLEIGCGIGRLTQWLVYRACKLTCLDICRKMIDRNRERLGDQAKKVNYLQVFGQYYHPEEPHDIAISSLVLIHNVNEDAFQGLVNMMSNCANTIFLFEHTDVAYQVSSHTRIRSEKELLSAFHNYRLEKRQIYRLFNDNLIFLKLIRQSKL